MFRSVVAKIVLVAFAGFALWMAFQVYGEVKRGQVIQAEISALEQEGSKIRQENSLLKDKIGYLQTDDFQEREAKDQLNYQEEGERVTIIKQNGAAASDGGHVTLSPDTGISPVTVTFQKPNYQKWWDTFFD